MLDFLIYYDRELDIKIIMSINIDSENVFDYKKGTITEIPQHIVDLINSKQRAMSNREYIGTVIITYENGEIESGLCVEIVLTDNNCYKFSLNYLPTEETIKN